MDLIISTLRIHILAWVVAGQECLPHTYSRVLSYGKLQSATDTKLEGDISIMSASAAATRVALVTGANQGIGKEIVRQLCRKFEGTVILAARNVDRGQNAVKELMSEGLQPVFLPLDVDSEESIQAARDALQTRFGRLDVLVNNAGVVHGMSSGMSLAEKARKTILTNYYGVLNVTNAFWSLIQSDGRIVNVSSGYGEISAVSKKIQDEILATDITIDKLSSIMDQYVKDCQLPKHEYSTKGWPSDGEYSSYSISKIGVNRLTEILAAKATSDASRPGILVNSVCPGWVRTQMGGSFASRSVEQGAAGPVYLALLPLGETAPHGEFTRDGNIRSWRT